jgi:hypothetical protein
MGRRKILHLLGAIVIALVPGCSRLWLDTYWRQERYVLIAVDTLSQMSLSFDEKGGTAEILVGPTVFAVGSDERYIVVKQHPSRDLGDSFDRSITSFFVVERTSSSSFSERQKRVRGPLSEKEFERLAASLSLPMFSKTFDDLK